MNCPARILPKCNRTSPKLERPGNYQTCYSCSYFWAHNRDRKKKNNELSERRGKCNLTSLNPNLPACAHNLCSGKQPPESSSCVLSADQQGDGALPRGILQDPHGAIWCPAVCGQTLDATKRKCPSPVTTQPAYMPGFF